MAAARSARRGCCSRWNFSLKIWRRQRLRTSWRARQRRPGRGRYSRSSASGPSRKPFPDHLPRERIVIAAPGSCPCCGSAKLSKLGEDITETLEVIPRQWKVIQTVREKFSCRECEKIMQPPAPFHVTPRGFAGPNLLAMILFEKFGQHRRSRHPQARSATALELEGPGCQTGSVMSPIRQNAASDRFNEIATVRIELRKRCLSPILQRAA